MIIAVRLIFVRKLK